MHAWNLALIVNFVYLILNKLRSRDIYYNLAKLISFTNKLKSCLRLFKAVKDLADYRYDAMS